MVGSSKDCKKEGTFYQGVQDDELLADSLEFLVTAIPTLYDKSIYLSPWWVMVFPVTNQKEIMIKYVVQYILSYGTLIGVIYTYPP